MHIDRLYWDDWNVEHIARHRVQPQEVGEVFASRGKQIYLAWKGRYRTLGRTEAGRYLMIVFDHPSRRGAAYVVTARDMDDKERALFNRRTR